MLADLHMHTEYSEDAKPDAAVESICRAAVERGLDIIALTDHKDFYYHKPAQYLDIEAQQRDIARCKAQFDGQLEILYGVELGEIHTGAQTADFLAAYRFDEVIGSLHTMPPEDIDIYFLPFAQMDCDAFLHNYFDEMMKMVRHGGFDVLAHLDYPLRVMKMEGYEPSFVGYEARIEPVLREIIDREIALEINAAGLFGWMKQIGPPRFVLDMYRNLGGTMLSIGSDSHCAPDAGRGIAQCFAYARAAGFTELTVFRNRKPIQMAL